MLYPNLISRICFVLAVTLLTLGAVLGQTPAETGVARLALVADVNGVIGPASARHVSDVISKSRTRGAEVLVLRLNTPGGLSTSMREIITQILESPVPVIGYVAPSGGHAASAGTYILYATHLAAMAPGTNIGAATPVQIGGLPSLPDPPGQKPEQQSDQNNEDTGEEGGKPETAAPAGDTMSKKAINDAVAYIRSLAELRGRDVEWAEQAVRVAATLSAEQALEKGVIEFIAVDLEDLLEQSDGQTVVVGKTERTLRTGAMQIELVEPGSLTRLLGVLANPNVAFLLMMLGMYGLIFEFSNPGVGSGVVGAIFLLLGLYSLNQLPLDYTGLALVLLGLGCMIAEAFTPSLGLLGIGGLVAFVFGSAMLIDTDIPAYQLSWTMIASTALLSGALMTFVLGYVWRAHRRPVHSGIDDILSSPGHVLDWDGRQGHVWLHGERWFARSDEPLVTGNQVRVDAIDGLELTVSPAVLADRDTSEETGGS